MDSRWTQRLVPRAHLPHTASSSLLHQQKDEAQWHRLKHDLMKPFSSSSEVPNTLAHLEEMGVVLKWKEK